MSIFIPQAQAKAEMAIGAVLLAAPVWVEYLQDVSAVLSFIAALCGALIGLSGVWRLHRGHKEAKKQP